jgi:hypothetical protein
VPTGIYVRTEECKKILRKAKKGNSNGKGNKGKPFSEEHKEKIRKAMEGNINGKGSEGKHYPKKSEVAKGKIGENSPNWKGGKKLALARVEAKRRNLGFIPWNSYYEGSEFHHMDKVGNGVYMPKEVHQGIYHNQFTGQGMDEMNALAMNYL